MSDQPETEMSEDDLKSQAKQLQQEIDGYDATIKENQEKRGKASKALRSIKGKLVTLDLKKN